MPLHVACKIPLRTHTDILCKHSFNYIIPKMWKLIKSNSLGNGCGWDENLSFRYRGNFFMHYYFLSLNTWQIYVSADFFQIRGWANVKKIGKKFTQIFWKISAKKLNFLLFHISQPFSLIAFSLLISLTSAFWHGKMRLYISA